MYLKWRNPVPCFRLFCGWDFSYISRIHTAYICLYRFEDSSILGTTELFGDGMGVQSGPRHKWSDMGPTVKVRSKIKGFHWGPTYPCF